MTRQRAAQKSGMLSLLHKSAATFRDCKASCLKELADSRRSTTRKRARSRQFGADRRQTSHLRYALGNIDFSVDQVELTDLSVHSSPASDFLAPIARSKRSVVARSAAIPFSSWPDDLNPLAERGSLSISRSFRFCRHSWIALQTIPLPPRLDKSAYTPGVRGKTWQFDCRIKIR